MLLDLGLQLCPFSCYQVPSVSWTLGMGHGHPLFFKNYGRAVDTSVSTVAEG